MPQLEGGGLADLRSHPHAGEADYAADDQRDRQGFVAAAGLADRGARRRGTVNIAKNPTTVSLPKSEQPGDAAR